jgi:prolyl-tRNA synthetase
MRQSKLFTKTSKTIPKDEVSLNAQLLSRGGYVDKLQAGVYTFLPLGFRVLKKIENIIREEMEAAGGQEMLMPALQPKENWMTTGRWDTYDSLFRFVSHYSKNEYALGPTHEEIVSPLAGKFIMSYKDLPAYVFQIQTKFRDEKRAKSGVLRGREFMMKDFYSFHADEADMDVFYEKMREHYENVFRRAGIGDATYLTFASGGSFSKYSHEFQMVTEAGEDIIYLCEHCRVAVNKEIVAEQNKCPKCGNEQLIEKKAIEVGNIFKLKTKYSEPFNLKFMGADGTARDVMMGCYGIGLGRLLGAIVEFSHDERGIVWPESVAPYRVHLINIAKSREVADNLYEELTKTGEEVLYDDRVDKGAGEKFADSDLLGLPYRVVVSDKMIAAGKVEVKKRVSDEVLMMTKEEFFRKL